MKVVFVNRFYRPDHSATAQMLTDLAEYLAGEGMQVKVITSRLSYEGTATYPARESLAGVEAIRIWTSRFGRSWLPGRAIDYATFYFSATLAMLRHVARGDVLVAKTDPPLISVPAALVARLKGARLVNWLQDLFPEVAAALGMKWAARWPGHMLARLRNWSLRQAAFNAAIHPKMAEKLERENVQAAQIRILPNWADRDLSPVAHADNPFAAGVGAAGQVCDWLLREPGPGSHA